MQCAVCNSTQVTLAVECRIGAVRWEYTCSCGWQRTWIDAADQPKDIRQRALANLMALEDWLIFPVLDGVEIE